MRFVHFKGISKGVGEYEMAVNRDRVICVEAKNPQERGTGIVIDDGGKTVRISVDEDFFTVVSRLNMITERS